MENAQAEKDVPATVSTMTSEKFAAGLDRLKGRVVKVGD